MIPFRPPREPHATRTVIGAIVLLYVVVALLVPRLSFELGLIPARLFGTMPAGWVPAPLTLVTNIFVHAGLVHLAFNMLFFLWVGRAVEWVLGPARMLAIFFVGGIAGNLLQAWMTAASTVPVVGASGAVAAVFAAYAVLFARPRADVGGQGRRALPTGLANALKLAGVWIGLQLAIGFLFNSESGGIAIWAHIGGFIAGLLLLQLMLRLRLRR